MSTRRQIRNLVLLVGGMVMMMTLHGLLQFTAPPFPSEAPGTDQDRFFARVFEPLEPAREEEGRWVQSMRISGYWFQGSTGRSVKIYGLTQDIDAHDPQHRYEKLCPAFGRPLTDWHPQVLTHFEARGYTFEPVTSEICLEGCRAGAAADPEACTAWCMRECSNQRLRIVHPPSTEP